MAYPDDAIPVKFQVLNAIEAKLTGITTANAYHHTLESVTVFDSAPSLLGIQTPSAAVVLVGDDYRRSYGGCLVDEREATVDIFGVLRISRMDPSWKLEAHWLISDMKRALALDLKLNTTATYHEFISEEVFEPSDDNLVLTKLSFRVIYRHETLDPTSLSGTV